MNKILKHLSSLALLVPTFACANIQSNIEVGIYGLYSSPNYETNGFCDLGINLTLDHSAINGDIAFLNNFVLGTCEINVSPNPRYYKLQKTYTDKCGTNTYKGTSLNNNELKITDHRGRYCQDNIAAKVVIKETIIDSSTGESVTNKYYSYDKY